MSKYWLYTVYLFLISMVAYAIIGKSNLDVTDNNSSVQLSDKFWQVDKFSDHTIAVDWSVTLKNLTAQKSSFQVFCDFSKNGVLIEQDWTVVDLERGQKKHHSDRLLVPNESSNHLGQCIIYAKKL